VDVSMGGLTYRIGACTCGYGEKIVLLMFDV
jgi:hypothetical protein